ncbi:ribosomal large subunit pseudouridine synthase B [Thermanaeromonas toyohensis ToBE]|uniref:Pseudouridine synthase n=1 Tax=Thermanaeromonas toyohensis ToBE TaxID=698762 RepID=A0A1W1VZR8_9FIRM|nr:pseudouridine synthase [Thermanaeromonas toyohensis]SMB98364.1 ribosomal large subunit pseudouridine synthase B [Thermanaeromonas toyohensis ToBE]
MRLQKYLAQAGVASRRRAEELIRAGRVKVNGETVIAMGFKVEPGRDVVEVDGKKVELRPQKVYYLLYKPAGYVSTARDPQGRPKVIDLLHGVKERVYPVGRLDYATEGLLLLTNDGDLTLRLTHPRYGVPKTYEALVEGIPDVQDLCRLTKGVKLEDGWTSPAEVKLLWARRGKALLELTLREGRKREVRRMCAAVGHPVIKLKRTKIAFLTLEGLKPGEYRELTKEEVEHLYRLTGLKES